MYFYGIDSTYILLVLPCILFAMWAQNGVSSTFNRYSKVSSRRHITGAQAAETVLRQNGVTGVRIESIAGNLTDHYDPRTNTIRLSSGVYNQTSVAAIGVAAHEAGHAVQYAHGYFPIKVRTAILPATQISSKLAMPLVILGLFFNVYFTQLGILLFAVATLFQLVTLPVEFNASSRALVAIQGSYMLDEDEYPMARKTLRAAALTYVAALAVSLAQLLRLVILVGGRNRD